MINDPRYRNRKIEATSINEYFSSYAVYLQEALKTVDQKKLDEAFNLLRATVERDGHVFVAGNGGSSAIANHLCCDFTKGIHVDGVVTPRIFSLVANVPVLTAFANDLGYERSLGLQLEMAARPGDLLIVISSSGNSPNILQAAHSAKRKNVSVLAFSGFSGGEIMNIADVCVHVDANNYGICEDAHQILMHTMSQYLVNLRETKS